MYTENRHARVPEFSRQFSREKHVGQLTGAVFKKILKLRETFSPQVDEIFGNGMHHGWYVDDSARGAIFQKVEQ